MMTGSKSEMVAVEGVALDPAALKELHDTLQRYAGWLDRERMSVAVRADVLALGLALDGSSDPWPLLEALDGHIAKLPSGDLRRLLRTAAGQIRRGLAQQA